jgi:peroxin-16
MNPLLLAMMGENPVLGLLSTLMGAGQSASSKEARPISDVEKMEWEKRTRAFWWYILRGPAWYSFTRPKLDSIVKRTQNRPLLGIVGGFIGDYLPLVDEYYYYSAT